MYWKGNYVQCDKKKSLQHMEQAAILEYETARHYLGIYEHDRGNFIRAVEHLTIVLSSDSERSLREVHELYMKGLVQKADYEQALRIYQTYLSEMQSERRDRAKAIIRDMP
jgi:TPR repeat protein